MRFRLRLGERTWSVQATREKSGKIVVEIDGRKDRFEVRRGIGALRVRAGRAAYTVVLGERSVAIDGETLAARLDHVRLSAAEESADAQAHHREVKPPMPGRVVEVRVSLGDRVKRGQPLVVLEAMKMQNEIAAPADGEVGEIRVVKGQTVESGQVLIVLR